MIYSPSRTTVRFQGPNATEAFLRANYGLMPLYVTAAAHFDQGFAIQHAALKAAGCEVIRFEGERYAP